MASHANRDPKLHNHGDEHGHGSRRDYIVGFLLSAVLTAVPFCLVMTGAIRGLAATALIIVFLAIMQVVVHVRFFLHVNRRGEDGWTLVSFIFTALIVLITIGGSIWAMYQLNTNMMPMSVNDVTQLP